VHCCRVPLLKRVVGQRALEPVTAPVGFTSHRSGRTTRSARRSGGRDGGPVFPPYTTAKTCSHALTRALRGVAGNQRRRKENRENTGTRPSASSESPLRHHRRCRVTTGCSRVPHSPVTVCRTVPRQSEMRAYGGGRAPAPRLPGNSRQRGATEEQGNFRKFSCAWVADHAAICRILHGPSRKYAGFQESITPCASSPATRGATCGECRRGARCAGALRLAGQRAPPTCSWPGRKPETTQRHLGHQDVATTMTLPARPAEAAGRRDRTGVRVKLQK
jgi:hypothetical protein